ncbi:MAG: LamG-like jellyroll fold domain-containing protein [Thiotrichaceae bacterium]
MNTATFSNTSFYDALYLPIAMVLTYLLTTVFVTPPRARVRQAVVAVLLMSVSMITLAATPPDSALSFNGSTDVRFPPSYSNMNFSGASNFTISMWFKGSGVLYKQHGMATGNHEIYLKADTSWIVFGVGKRNVAWDFFVNSTQAINVNVWNHVSLTKSGSTISLYINGQLDKQMTASGSLTATATSGNLYIGSDGGNAGSFFAGQIDEAQFWNVARVQSDIQSDMYSHLAGNELGLVAYFDFDQTSGTTLTDRTASGYHGTVTGTATWITSGAMTPFILAATQVTPTGFTANWNALSGATGYRIDVSTDPNFATFIGQDIAAPVGTSFNVTGLTLTAGTPYYYRMRVEKTGWTSPNSANQTVLVSPGNALLFATNQRVNCEHWRPSLKPTAAFTVEAWVKPTTNSQGGYGGAGNASDSKSDGTSAGTYFAINSNPSFLGLYGMVMTAVAKRSDDRQSGSTLSMAARGDGFSGTSLTLYQNGIATHFDYFSATTISPSTKSFVIAGSGHNDLQV